MASFVFDRANRDLLGGVATEEAAASHRDRNEVEECLHLRL